MRSIVLIVAGCLVACAPALDWREIRPQGTGAVILFPCKPTEDSRRVSMAGSEVDMALLACEAGGTTWALAHADVADPAKVSRALDELSRAAVRNIAAAAASSAPATIAGMTPNASASRLRAEGKRPGGATVHSDTTVFAKGTRVYQATVLATSRDAAAVDTFIASVRWP